jgi:hypothetical protein
MAGTARLALVLAASAAALASLARPAAAEG